MTPLALFLMAGILTALARRYAIRRGMLDHPNARSSHTLPTPRGCGIGFVVPVIGAAVLLTATGYLALRCGLALISGGLMVAGTGLVDDWRPLSARTRLLIQAAAALQLIILVNHPVAQTATLLWAAVIPVVSALGIVWMINLTNFMDGIDGLAASQALFFTSFLAVLPASPGVSKVMLISGAAVAGFLLFNWPPAKVFMGDTGSGFLGFLFAWFCYSSDVRMLGVAAILIAPFVTDATVTLARRVLQGSRWSEAHRCHAYQHAAQRWGHLRVLVFVWVLSLAWLAPLAWCAWLWPSAALGFLILAYVPVLLLVYVNGTCKGHTYHDVGLASSASQPQIWRSEFNTSTPGSH